MKALNEIKEEVAKNNGYISWSNIYHLMLNGGIGLAYYTRLWEVIVINFAEQALDEAADKVELFPQEQYSCEGGCTAEIDKQTILSIKEQLR